MFAVIETGGKQYKVEVKSQIEVEKLDSEKGKSIKIDKVLLTSDKGKTKVGTPYISGASVSAKVLEEKKGEKIRVFKMKPKKRYQRTIGHRQKYTVLEITDIKS